MSPVSPTAIDWYALSPSVVLAATLVIGALGLPRRAGVARHSAAGDGAARTAGARDALVALAVGGVGLVGAAGLLVALAADGRRRAMVGGRVVVGEPGAVAGLAVTLAAFAALVVVARGSGRRRAPDDAAVPRFVTHLVAATLGLLVLCSARDAVMVVVGVELVALAATGLRDCFAGDRCCAGRAAAGRAAGVVALALEGYAVALAAVAAGSTRLVPLGRRLDAAHRMTAAAAVALGIVAIAARLGAVAWPLLSAARLRPRWSRPRSSPAGFWSPRREAPAENRREGAGPSDGPR